MLLTVLGDQSISSLGLKLHWFSSRIAADQEGQRGTDYWEEAAWQVGASKGWKSLNAGGFGPEQNHGVAGRQK